ncbi:hypothetical protein [Pseudomonas schmalbachii]|uniref:Uncharacterized protein n=1 Tax=Pseudomonas schmalbachii TaxID=2816993 RepID=A0ABS3TXL8_9PSED|nr:hypothetical protein [Pseudomonas schmalbachii]MBO3277425.1 hypothetical protein [Pseudomonas schmalbachii]
MSLEKRTADALAREAAARSGERAQRLDEINERFERLVKSGVVQPERYNIAPINPSSLTSQFNFK